jgi:hypothetical protein
MFCVVGLRPDGMRVQIDEGLTKERAEHVRKLLVNANAFPTVLVEPDEARNE